MDDDLNRTRTQYPICTRSHTYEELQGNLIWSRLAIHAGTLRRDVFQLNLVKRYTLPSALTIVENYYVAELFQLITLLEGNKYWKHIPSDMTLIFYEFIVGLNRFSSEIKKRANIVDPASNADIPASLNERENVLRRLTFHLKLFKEYLENSDTLTLDQITAMKEIIKHYTDSIDESLEHLIDMTFDIEKYYIDISNNTAPKARAIKILEFKQKFQDFADEASMLPQKGTENLAKRSLLSQQLEDSANNMGLNQEGYSGQQAVLSNIENQQYTNLTRQSNKSQIRRNSI